MIPKSGYRFSDKDHAPRKIRSGRPIQMMQAFIRCLATVLMILAVASPAMSPALAQSYPARRITIVVPFSPGTTFDLIARTDGQRISERYGQPVVVDNKPGASGSLGSEMVASAAPDGYMLVTAGAPLAVHKALIKDLRYDPLTSFTPIATVAASSVEIGRAHV